MNAGEQATEARHVFIIHAATDVEVVGGQGGAIQARGNVANDDELNPRVVQPRQQLA
jgi:hypothetical protein